MLHLLRFLILVVDKGKLGVGYINSSEFISVIYRHWVLEAAVAWKEYGTLVTGYDMVDISRNMLLCAAENGVQNNVRFVRGNLCVLRSNNQKKFQLLMVSKHF